MLGVERLALLLSIFASAGRCRDGRPSFAQLRAATGCSTATLSPNYECERSAETIEKIGRTAARFLRVDPEKLLRWLAGREEPVLQAHLELEARKVRCTGKLKGRLQAHTPSAAGLEPGWYDLLVDEKENYKPSQRRCTACWLRMNERVGDAWAAQILSAPKVPYQIRHAVKKILPTGRTLTYELLAEHSQMDLEELRRLLALHEVEKPRKGRKNLDKWLAIVLTLSGVSASPASAHRNNVVELGVGRKKKKGAAAVAAVKKKKGRRGRPPGEAAGEVSRRRLPQTKALRGRRQPATDQLALWAEQRSST